MYKHTKAFETVPFTHRILTGVYKGHIKKGLVIQIDGAPHKIVSIKDVEFKGPYVTVTGKASPVKKKAGEEHDQMASSDR